MNVVYRFRIYPNKSQRELFSKTFGCVRIKQHRAIADDLQLKGVTVYLEADGKYYVSLLYCCGELPVMPVAAQTAS
ncbi:helix-turn-helix domain-containing protein [Clostridium sp. MCC353]|uniref:helix-turn-helix domain-containing protein n=1 Tax=Clostridium sp. MCC353 TaxID=2592646 RepID=UPI001C014A9A|nr:helix-turn-helix domain-containing protein [Clostridium sp. MCC353]